MNNSDDQKLPCGMTADHLDAAARRRGYDGIPADVEALRALLALEANDPTPEPEPGPRCNMREEISKYQRAPKDTIPRRGLTVDSLRQIDAMTGSREHDVRHSGTPVFDVDGNPIAVTETEVYRRDATGGFVLDPQMAAKLSADELANCHILGQQKGPQR